MRCAASACEILRRKSPIAHVGGTAISAGKNEPDLVQHAARVFDACDEKTRSCCARGDVAFLPSFPDSPTAEYSFRKTGRTRERRHYARGCPSPPDGRQKLRQAGGAPNRKFPAAPAATPAGFGLSKRPANTQLPVITLRRCNGVSTALQIPLQSAQCVNFPQKHSFPQKHLNCGETMPEFSARYEIAFSARARVCSGGVGESVAVSPVRRRGKVFP